MKILNIKYCLLLTTYTIITVCQAQEGYYDRPYPIVGDTISDYTFTDIVNFEKDSASISDFRGKWLILDYWSEGCGACLNSFPKMNALHEQFKDQVQIMMIGIPSGFEGISKSSTKEVYNVMSTMYSLSLFVAFDTVTAKHHDIGTIPHLLIIDPNGVLHAKAMSIDSTQMEKLLSGKSVDFQIALSRTEEEEIRMFYNANLPVLVSGGLANGGIDTNFYYRSVLAPFDKKHMTYKTTLFFESERLKKLADKDIENGRIELRGVTVEDLYRSAFFGLNYWSESDALYQKYSYKIKKGFTKNINSDNDDKERYAYSLSVPKNKSTKQHLLKCMQTDLERYFGYKAEIKRIRMPVIFLKVKDKKMVGKLRNTTGTNSHKNSEIILYQGFNAKNLSMRSFVPLITSWVREVYNLPMYNKTNIDYNLDISIDTNLLDPQNGIKELERLGFEFIKGEKKLETIVLSD